MTVIRIKHNKENPYVLLNRRALWNPELSLKAIGLWARCMSRPDDWEFHIVELVKSCVEGRRAIYSAIDELIEHGYALRMEYYEKNLDGKFKTGGVEYMFFEFPVTEEEKVIYIEEFKKSFRKCGFGDRRDGHLRNVPLLSNEEEPSSKQEPKKEREREKGKLSPHPQFSYKRVKMDTEKYNSLLNDFGGDKIKEMIEGLDEYADLNPKRFKAYGCHSAVIRKWIRDDAKKNATNPKPQVNTNKEWARQVFDKIRSKCDVDIWEEALVFIGVGSAGDIIFKFSEHGFKEQVTSRLRKMGIVAEGLMS